MEGDSDMLKTFTHYPGTLSVTPVKVCAMKRDLLAVPMEQVTVDTPHGEIFSVLFPTKQHKSRFLFSGKQIYSLFAISC